MKRRTITAAALAAVLVPVAAAPAATSAPTAVRTPYVDKRVNACEGPRPGCNPGAVAHYWYKRGSASRGVGWGKDGHTGPKYPKNTRICVQFKGLSKKACVTLK